MTKSKLVYIASPFAGDIEGNIAFARRGCLYAIAAGNTPIAVHLLYPQMLNDDDPTQRETGLRCGLDVLERCDELWVCGDRISSGMQREIAHAIEQDITIHHIPPRRNRTGCRAGHGRTGRCRPDSTCPVMGAATLPALTLGSLFDGIGGFPLAAVRNGVTPLWASEIEAFPMEVTNHHFPRMRHVGDITALNGAALPPVDIITGGSPCQDLSVAGHRAGLAGERSGLFMEQIRVTKEMRCADALRGRADEYVRPRFFCWENVPGAFSSGQPAGEDFRIVLEEICRIADGTVSLPGPPSGRWEPAGAILGEKFSLAWRVLDAQYWPGTPQRRRRIFVVADFGGSAAPQILFEQDRLFGHPAQGEGARQGVAAAAGGCADGTGRAGRGNTCPDDTLVAPRPVAFSCNQRDEVRDLHDVAGAVCATQTIKQQTMVAYAEPSESQSVASGTDYLTPWDTQQGRIFTGNGVAPTLAGADGGGGRNPAGLLFAAGFSAGASPTAGTIGYQAECAPTLKAGSSGTNMVPTVLCLNDQGGSRMDVATDVAGALRAEEKGHQPIVLFEGHGKDARYNGPLDACPTISASYGQGGGNIALAMEPDSFCIAGNIIDRQPHNGGHHMGFQADISYTLNTCDRHAVYSRQRVDVFAENDVVATQSARQYKDATDLICRPAPCHRTVGTIEKHQLVRRLTPLECERLQGFPDHWTLVPGCSDTARYKALGNSVAIPCVEFILRGIAYFLRVKENRHDPKTEGHTARGGNPENSGLG